MPDARSLATPPVLQDQWSDFLLRRFDVYALAKYEILLKEIGDVAGKTALVVGAGSGEFVALLAQAGAKVTAIDIDEASVKLARRTMDELQLPADYYVSRLEEFPTDRAYDLVCATDVIEHIEDDAAAVRKISELTHDGGTITITVPALQSLFGYHDEILGHYRRYDRRQLEALMKPWAEPLFMRYFGFSLIPVALVLSRLLRRSYPVKAVGTEFEKPSLVGRILRMVFAMERVVRPPVGTSLLYLGRKKVRSS
jgi:SAM-dependent methyltransferase